MLTLALLALLATETIAPAPPPLTVLVLTSGRSLPIASYAQRGRSVTVKTASGEPYILRAEDVDMAASIAATEAEARAAEEGTRAIDRERQAAAEAEAIHAAERQRIATLNAAHLAQSHGAGGISVIGDSRPASKPEAGKPAAASAEPSAGNDLAAQLDSQRARWSIIVARSAELAAEHSELVNQYNANLKMLAGMAARTAILVRMQAMQSELRSLASEGASLRGEYKATQEAARRAELPPRVWNQSLSGTVASARD